MSLRWLVGHRGLRRRRENGGVSVCVCVCVRRPAGPPPPQKGPENQKKKTGKKRNEKKKNRRRRESRRHSPLDSARPPARGLGLSPLWPQRQRKNTRKNRDGSADVRPLRSMRTPEFLVGSSPVALDGNNNNSSCCCCCCWCRILPEKTSHERNGRYPSPKTH